MIDIQQKKSKILEFLEQSGPSLPVQVARAIQMDPVFASAILSELLSSKQIKTSHMKIGSSPLYLLPGQEIKLEEKTENLKSIEKEVQEKLKNEKIIYDESEEPATRVALRNIKDFATPFKFNDKIVWKYAFASQEEIDKMLLLSKKEKTEKEKESTNIKISETEETPQKEEPEKEGVPKAWEAKKEEISKAKEESKEKPKIENIFQKEKQKESKTPETFLEKIEHFLNGQSTTITSLEKVDKKEVVAIIESEEKTSMLFAFNKLRITESELMKCYKTADKKNLPYQIITKGNLTKKLTETIKAYQKLLKVNKLNP